MDTSIDENDSELEKCRSSTGKITSLSTIEAELFHHNVRDNIATTTATTRRRSVSNDSETRANDRKSEEAFLKANYKYKRRASWVLSGANCYLLAASGIVKYLRKVQRYVRCVKMLNNCPIVLLMAIIMSLGFTDMTEAGACWVERMDNGKCKELYSKNVSREECCGRGYEFAFTEKDMSDAEYFFTAAIGGGTNCVSCLDSCDVAKCGPGKRCVIRKGRPKCICAPICKTSKEKKLKKNPIRVIAGNDKITDINFGIPLNREIRSLSELGQSQHEIETDSTALAELKKNQRKSNTTKRRKHKANRTNHENVESIQLPRKSKPRAKLKSDRFVVTAGNGEHNLGKLENSVKRKKKNNSSSKNVVIVQNSPNVDQSQQHHSRHQYKKHRKGNKDQKVNGQNTTISNRRPHRPSQPNQSTNVALDEKIRGGFFNHGFPYPPNDLTQMVHGRYFNPVCGTDGKTYKTECQLKKRACRREATSLTVAYRGYCQTSCKSVQCLRGLSCVEDQYGIPHCIACTITCPQDDLSPVIDPAKAVCGVDGRTYKSVCDINRMICTTSRSIAVAYNGPCQDEANCNTIHCGDRKICLTDLVTHKPRCVSCSFKCPRKRRPQGQRYEDVKICGNNNHTYHSWCQMRRDSCNTEFYIDVKHVGACHKDSFSTGIMDFH